MTKDEAAAVLVEAGLRGHPEQRGVVHGDHGDCALGIVHLALHGGVRQVALRCPIGPYPHLLRALGRECVWRCPIGSDPTCVVTVGFGHTLMTLIFHLFERHHLDALTIGRKLESLVPLPR